LLLDREWFAFSQHKTILGIRHMNALSRLLFAGFLIGGAAADFAAPAHATLQFTVGVADSTATFTCVDNDTTCDSNPTQGIITLSSFSLDGIVVTDVVAQSSGNQDFPGAPALSYSIGSIFNGSDPALRATFALSDTGFRAPAKRFHTSANVAWTNASDSTVDLFAYLDPNNAQGGNTPTDAPGDQIGAFPFAASAGDQTQSASGVLSLSASYSLSDQGTLFLEPGATVSGGQSTTVSAVVPEPSTWATMLIGFAGLGFAGYGRLRRRPATA
jgi:hypothetical protein